MISIVIRTYNECKYVERLLNILRYQNIKNEVIIVDSNSTDDTEKIADKYRAKYVNYSPFTYGGSINIGIENSIYDYICILSGHCHPIKEDFLKKLYLNFRDKDVAGVYAKHIPSDSCNIIDKRDMLIMFRNERKVQTTDSFFNNGASMIRKDIWNKIKFSETAAGFEDIIWAKEVQGLNYKIIYDPTSMILHHHTEPIKRTLEKYSNEYKILKEIEI